MTSKADQAVQERRLRPIYDALDSGNFKKAIQEADKVLKKHPKTNCAKALKALAFIRTERLSEASEILEEVDTEKAQHDENTLSALNHCYKEADVPEKLISLYERAVAQAPTETNLTNLFTAYVRNRDYKKQQAIAMRLFKETSNSPFFYWTIMSIVMQAHQDPALAQKMFLPLAQKMMTAHLVKTPYKYLQEIDLHLMVLEGLKQYKDCAALLQSDELQQFEHSRSQIIQKLLNLHIQSKNYDEVERITWTELEDNPDDWYLWKCLVEVGFEKIVESENSNAEAVEFWQRTCDLADRKLAYRGPKMAKLYFLMKLRSGPEKTKNLDSAALAQGSPVYIMLAYIKQFFSKPTCFPDLRMFISMLNDEEKKALDNLMTLFVGDILSAEEAKEGDETQIWAIVLYEKMRRAMQLTDGMTREEKRKHIRHVMSQMMTNGLSDLAGGALTQLIAVVLWEEWKKNGDRQAAFELLLILEWSAIRFKADPFAKILLIKIYAYYGRLYFKNIPNSGNLERYIDTFQRSSKYLYSKCPLRDSIHNNLSKIKLGKNNLLTSGNLLRITALTKLLDIKSMQKEALGYLTFPLFEMSGRINMAIVHYTSLSAFYDNAEREVIDCVVSAYKNGGFAHVQPLVELADNMKWSMQVIFLRKNLFSSDCVNFSILFLSTR
ncbi:hypothetical protein WR25_26845 isoform B [Diploscapter pachys]|uniref:N-terminal acetyltransferase B complex subunit MDM20 homolog n=1 Tax=Diploscapter pachys TaxID=2018661 RepID=A0A2A2KZN5_9BILA|nr:hypothetical protein WR25_26845 isoform B [Diploscapter pachys]